MRDIDVRKAVRKRLDRLHAGDDDTLVVEEMGLWANYVRVDVAVINGEFHGFELKSARDTLERLPRQAAVYNEIFDRVTLVLAENHLEKAADHVPEWWGLITARSVAGGSVRLHKRREARFNPSVSAIHVARLFWRAEAISVLEKHELARGFRSKRAEQIARRLADELPLDVLRGEARAAIKCRDRLGQPIADV
jgi:hypothetical protein